VHCKCGWLMVSEESVVYSYAVFQEKATVWKCDSCGRTEIGTEQIIAPTAPREPGTETGSEETEATRPAQPGSTEAWNDEMYYSSERPGPDGGR